MWKHTIEEMTAYRNKHTFETDSFIDGWNMQWIQHSERKHCRQSIENTKSTEGRRLIRTISKNDVTNRSVGIRTLTLSWELYLFTHQIQSFISWRAGARHSRIDSQIEVWDAGMGQNAPGDIHLGGIHSCRDVELPIERYDSNTRTWCIWLRSHSSPPFDNTRWLLLGT